MPAKVGQAEDAPAVVVSSLMGCTTPLIWLPSILDVPCTVALFDQFGTAGNFAGTFRSSGQWFVFLFLRGRRRWRRRADISLKFFVRGLN